MEGEKGGGVEARLFFFFSFSSKPIPGGGK